jgi:hypothetical protein
MKIIEQGRRGHRQDLQHRQSGQQLLDPRTGRHDAGTGGKYPEYADSAKQVKIVETTSGAYYGEGYQDVKNRAEDHQHLRRAGLEAIHHDGRRIEENLRCLPQPGRRRASAGELRPRRR